MHAWPGLSACVVIDHAGDQAYGDLAALAKYLPMATAVVEAFRHMRGAHGGDVWGDVWGGWAVQSRGGRGVGDAGAPVTTNCIILDATLPVFLCGAIFRCLAGSVFV